MADEKYSFVLRNFLAQSEWHPFCRWTDGYMSEKFGHGKCAIVRVGEKRHPKGQILHDHHCQRHKFESIAAMFKWMRGSAERSSADEETTSSSIHPSRHWAYLDYKDVLELLEEEEAKKVDWSRLGVIPEGGDEDEHWRDSTIWIGTPGAYTPCHFDTYGFNLHAQLRGFKRWLLFPPSSREKLWPTRLPYEESSVFSALDLIGADQRLDENAMVWEVTVGPGDLLFVPPKWWHSVQCVEKEGNESQHSVCVSVNKWFSDLSDNRESCKEALLKFMMALYVESGLLEMNEHICLTERGTMDDLDGLAELAETRLGTYHQLALARNESSNGDSDHLQAETNPPEKRPKLEVSPHQPSSHLKYFYDKFSLHPSAEQIEPIPWEKYRRRLYIVDRSKSEKLANSIDDSDRLKMELLDAMSSSEVLDTLLDVVMRRRKEQRKLENS